MNQTSYLIHFLFGWRFSLVARLAETLIAIFAIQTFIWSLREAQTWHGSIAKRSRINDAVAMEAFHYLMTILARQIPLHYHHKRRHCHTKPRNVAKRNFVIKFDIKKLREIGWLFTSLLNEKPRIASQRWELLRCSACIWWFVGMYVSRGRCRE